MSSFNLHHYTFIRLAIPLIAGVFCGDWFFDENAGWLGSIVLFCFTSALTLLSYYLKRYSLRWCFGISFFIFCFMGGWLAITSQLKQSDYVYPQEESVYRVLLTDKPESKERSYLCRVILKERKDSLKSYSIDKQAILYLPKDSLVSHLSGGEELLVSTRISSPKNSGNFDEFDYARYLKRKGISGAGYVAPGKWKQLSLSTDPNGSSHHTATSFLNMAASYREKILSLYRKLGFEGDELAVLSALTIGDKTELSESIRESYSVSGASHVLALSGLHIGFLYGMFFFILKPITERWRAGRYLRSIFLIVSLWAFAFFTGLSPSVVRSACMFSILAFADLFRQHSFSLNTVAATAFLMLLVHPVWLFDVGFQLSFLAVVAILLLQPPIYKLISVKSKLGKYVWGLTSVSIAAQVGTAPLVLLYFSRFSTHFLLTNLVVIPLVSLILYTAVFMLLLTPLEVLQNLVASVVRFLLKILNGFARWVEQLPYASLDGIWLYRIEVVLIYVFFLFVCHYVVTRRAKSLFFSLSCLLTISVFHVVMNGYDRPCRSIVFYNIRHCPVVHCMISNGHSWLVYADSLPDKKQLCRVASNYWMRHHLQVPTEVVSNYQSDHLQVTGQLLSFDNCRVCMISDNRWENKTAITPLAVDYLYLCRGYKGTVKQLTSLFMFSCVVLDASLPEQQKETLSDECKLLGFTCHSPSVKGALSFSL